MPLLDHFRPPLSPNFPWKGFHARWASAIADALNDVLPDYYLAAAQVDFGPRIETASAPPIEPALAPPQAILPMTFPVEFGVDVFHLEGGTRLAAAVELVSPGNKDRPEARRQFAAKCSFYASSGVGLIVVDVVTARHSRPFDELMALLGPARPVPEAGPLTAASFRPVRIDGMDSLEVRVDTLEVGGVLPELPLALGGLGHVMLDLEATYEDARRHSRLP